MVRCVARKRLHPRGIWRMNGSILISFEEGNEPCVSVIADSDRAAEALQVWLNKNFSGWPKGLTGEGAPIANPGPALHRGEQVEECTGGR